MAKAARQTGTVRWFNGQKGYGFIAPDEGGEDLFVHQSSILSDGYRTLSEGEPVEFAVEVGNEGRTKAIDITGPDGSRLRDGGGGFGVGRGGGGGNFGWGSGRNGGGGGVGFGGECYNCRKVGHMARDCQERRDGGGGRFGGGGGGCYSCNQPGHIARECPNVGGRI